jgi:hypothetical protein
MLTPRLVWGSAVTGVLALLGVWLIASTTSDDSTRTVGLEGAELVGFWIIVLMVFLVAWACFMLLGLLFKWMRGL